ncbi:MAG: PAS domain S-box protein [Melioribacteraceae bacterium]|nr:PAS domain S-box protein [Melioribacteraceae bacterium]
MLLNARQIERAFGKEKVILLAIEDITRRKREEKSLREKNQLTSEYLDILLDRARTPIIIWDSSLVINRFNLEFEKLSGYESSEVIDKPIKILFPKDRADSFIDLLKNHLSDKNSEAYEIDILTKDKNIKTVLWNSTGIFDKEDRNIVATIAQDITERKQTTEKLASLETRYRRLFESAQDGILILDAETGKIIDANPFLCELLDYSKENFIDKKLWQIGFFKDIAANKEKFLELQQKWICTI